MKTHILLIIGLLVLVACAGTKMPSSVNTVDNTVSTGIQGKNVEEKDTVRSSRKQAIINDSAQYKRKDSSNTNVSDLTSTTDSVNIVSQVNDTTSGKGKAYLSPNISPTISDADLKKMYKKLEMTDEQIQSFEKSMRDFGEKVKYHANGEMLGSVGNEQERQLKEVLKENQWKEYQAWKKTREP